MDSSTFEVYNTEEFNKCRASNQPLGNFTDLPLSQFQHAKTRIAASESKNELLTKTIPILAEFLALGDGEAGHFRAETFDSKLQKWEPVDDYPFAVKAFKFLR